MSNCDCNCQKIDISFEDKSENLSIGLEDKSEDIRVEMADPGSVLVRNVATILRGTTTYWNQHSRIISKKDALYLYTDYKKKKNPDGTYTNIPGFKIGDGLAYLIDLPFINDLGVDITEEDILRWNNKWRGYMDPVADENLVFTTN